VKNVILKGGLRGALFICLCTLIFLDIRAMNDKIPSHHRFVMD
jgi:hypothetical protein